MKKIVNPVVCEVYNGIADGFVKIIFENGRLSMTGVIGPLKSGNCKGSAGQCTEEIRKGQPKEPWTREMVDKLCQVWDDWHLNDARPYCSHQKKLGWAKIASETVSLYHYRMTREAVQKSKEAEQAALNALKTGTTFIPTEEQTKYASLRYFLRLPEKIAANSELSQYYEPKKSLYPGDQGFIEENRLGWLRKSEHPEGLLCKPCPVCGYKYGTSWLKEEVPQEVVNWLFSLPDTAVMPVWV